MEKISVKAELAREGKQAGTQELNDLYPVADPDLELRRGGGEFFIYLPCCLFSLLSVLSFMPSGGPLNNSSRANKASSA